jgi:multiple sugar transport system substrate-binding protein
VFLEAVSTAKHFPYVRQWSDIDVIINEAVVAALQGRKTPEQALKEAAAKVDKVLSG